MLRSAKRTKLQLALKSYVKRYLSGGMTELDESGTRLMVNHFLTEILGFKPIEEVRTEYMIKGTYADYVIQMNGIRHFLVEVKALSLSLSDKHLRQAINYGANEGIEWALLTNGRSFELHKILFNKPIESKRVFSFDLSDPDQLKDCIDAIQFLHRDVVSNKGLNILWGKYVALDPINVATLLYSPTVMNHIRKSLKQKYKIKLSDEEVVKSLNRILLEVIQPEMMKFIKIRREKKPKENIISESIIEATSDSKPEV